MNTQVRNCGSAETMPGSPCFCYVSTLEGPEARVILESWKREHSRCAVFALVPEGEISRLPALQTACREVGVKLLGGVFPRVIHDGYFSSNGVWLFRLDEEPPWGLIEKIDPLAPNAAEQLVVAVEPVLSTTGPNPTLFLMFDAMTANIGSILDEVYLELGAAVRYLGVSAGSETFQPISCLFDDSRALGGGVLWMLLPATQRSVLMHDYVAPSRQNVATSTSGNRVASIDFRPAFEFYREQVQLHFGVELTQTNFYQYAVLFPFGIDLANGQLLVRMPVRLDEDGSIWCVGEIPEHSLLVVMRAPTDGSDATGAALTQRLIEQKVQHDMMFFYCAGRRMRLGDESEIDLRSVISATGAEIGGALSLGEIGSFDAGAYPLFHNGAFVCLGWGSA